MHNINKIPNKYLVNILINSKITFALHFLELLHKKSVKMERKKKIMRKKSIFGATNLRQPSKFYTTAGCDG